MVARWRIFKDVLDWDGIRLSSWEEEEGWSVVCVVVLGVGVRMRFVDMEDAGEALSEAGHLLDVY